MTRRLVLVIVATVAATLLLVGGTTLVFATLQARSRTEADLKELAASINEGLAQSGQTTAGVRPLALTAFRRALRLDGIEVDLARREARVAGRPVALANREFDLLAFLAAHQGQALSRQQLLDGAWGADWYGDERTVDVHVRQLRKKLGEDLPLATVWGVGYRLG